jgi:hypothetical protein
MVAGVFHKWNRWAILIERSCFFQAPTKKPAQRGYAAGRVDLLPSSGQEHTQVLVQVLTG